LPSKQESNESKQQKKEKQMKAQLNSIMPATLQEKLDMANIFVKSNLMPRGLDKPEKVVIALEMGHELGIPPLIAIMNIAVINNQPTLKADMMTALALRSGKIEDMKIEFFGNEHQNDDNFGCKVTIKRRNIATPFSVEFTRRDAKVAGLFNKDNWRKYERRMLKHRAVAYCVRDSLPEIFAGIYIPEELENSQQEIIETEVIEEIEEIENTEEFLEDNTVEITNDHLINKYQLNAIRILSKKLLSSGIIESYIYDKFQKNKLEEISEQDAGDIILMLQNEPEIINLWIEQTYKNTA
jgi:hypothetical protein